MVGNFYKATDNIFAFQPVDSVDGMAYNWWGAHFEASNIDFTYSLITARLEEEEGVTFMLELL